MTSTRSRSSMSSRATSSNMVTALPEHEKHPVLIEDEDEHVHVAAPIPPSNRKTATKSPKKRSRTNRSSKRGNEDYPQADTDSSVVEVPVMTIEKASETCTKRRNTQTRTKTTAKIVTPSTAGTTSGKNDMEKLNHGVRGLNSKARRALVVPPLAPVSETSSASSSSEEGSETTAASSDDNESILESGGASETTTLSTKRNWAFGRTSIETISVQPNVRKAYSIVSRLTGSIGGNGSGGAIYGELTVGSMQKMVNLMKEHAGLNEKSRFIDIGSGLGKPNIHVSQDPGVAFSYGIEMEHVRWLLGMTNLRKVLHAAAQERIGDEVKEEDRLGYRCIFEHGDITDATFLDPFTHVYMFDIGFPPLLFYKLAEMFNRSESEYLICYHCPKLIIDAYEFNVELITQTPTSMHGSSENHMGYLYRRRHSTSKQKKRCSEGGQGLPSGIPCDPLFAGAWRIVEGGLQPLSAFVDDQVHEEFAPGRKNRTRNGSRSLRR